MSDLRYFLVIYDSRTRTVQTRDLGDDGERAAEEYANVEEKLQGQEEVEVVLLGAESLETIRTTHSHYFEHESENGSEIRTKLAAGDHTLLRSS